jgi:hypothetical protein
VFNEASSEIKPVRECFFPLGLVDPASFHQLLAVLALHLPFHRPKELNKSIEYETTEIMIHHGEAVKMVQTRLPDIQAATSDGTIGASKHFPEYNSPNLDVFRVVTHLDFLKKHY